jgi:hypothetical protein
MRYMDRSREYARQRDDTRYIVFPHNNCYIGYFVLFCTVGIDEANRREEKSRADEQAE